MNKRDIAWFAFDIVRLICAVALIILVFTQPSEENNKDALFWFLWATVGIGLVISFIKKGMESREKKVQRDLW